MHRSLWRHPPPHRPRICPNDSRDWVRRVPNRPSTLHALFQIDRLCSEPAYPQASGCHCGGFPLLAAPLSHVQPRVFSLGDFSQAGRAGPEADTLQTYLLPLPKPAAISTLLQLLPALL